MDEIPLIPMVGLVASASSSPQLLAPQLLTFSSEWASMLLEEECVVELALFIRIAGLNSFIVSLEIPDETPQVGLKAVLE